MLEVSNLVVSKFSICPGYPPKIITTTGSLCPFLSNVFCANLKPAQFSVNSSIQNVEFIIPVKEETQNMGPSTVNTVLDLLNKALE